MIPTSTTVPSAPPNVLMEYTHEIIRHNIPKDHNPKLFTFRGTFCCPFKVARWKVYQEIFTFLPCAMNARLYSCHGQVVGSLSTDRHGSLLSSILHWLKHLVREKRFEGRWLELGCRTQIELLWCVTAHDCPRGRDLQGDHCSRL